MPFEMHGIASRAIVPSARGSSNPGDDSNVIPLTFPAALRYHYTIA